MKAQKVWVPGEVCDDGMLVTDAKTGEEFYVDNGEVGDLDYPLGAGRFKKVKAIRCPVVPGGSPLTLARLPGGKVIHVRIVAGWQFFNGKMPSVESECLPELPETAA
jgi:hypothetical protein